MNAVEIEEAISKLAEKEFDPSSFPFAFLEAFGNSSATIKRLKSGQTNSSDIKGGVLQRNNIHIAVCQEGATNDTLLKLKASSTTVRARARFVVATDGIDFEAEDLISDDPPIVCAYQDFPDHFGFFLPLAGISTVKQIRESSFDIKATGRLNRLYVQLIQDNPHWSSAERRVDMNHFMARLIFCFFAEDTDIFKGSDLFTSTIEQMSQRDSSNTHEVMQEIFRAMGMEYTDRKSANLPRWANSFPFVNGGLFSGSTSVPVFSKIARSYLLHIGNLEWTKINPDIFGSMIQAVTDDEERGSLGLHYTSVPNILKVLNPLFLDDLRAKLDEAGDNARKLLNLRNRMAKIRVFDPACGSGNFLVIAYKQMREIESQINSRRGEGKRTTEIPLTNFRGIELRSFPAEIARLALVIAEYQCDVLYRGQIEAYSDFLPLDSMNWITCGNALRLDWLYLCPPTGKSIKHLTDDLLDLPLDQNEIDYENEGGETYICGNPPYRGSTWQSAEQKSDIEAIFGHRTSSWRSLDYVAGWFMKAADYGEKTRSSAAFVSTNSICQGSQVPILWPLIQGSGHEISFAHTSFKWANLASHNAGVTVVIVGICNYAGPVRQLFSLNDDGNAVLKETANINAYLVSAPNIIVLKASKPINGLENMSFGNKPVDDGNLLLSRNEVRALNLTKDQEKRFIRRIYGSAEFIQGRVRYCLWIEDDHLDEAKGIKGIQDRIEGVHSKRLASRDKSANVMADRAHQFREMNIGKGQTIVIPGVSSENRRYLPIGLIDNKSTVTNACFAIFDGDLWNLALLVSRLHLIWIATVCGKLKSDFRYSNTLGWNTYPVPELTSKNRADLTSTAQDILLTREAHYPATIADLYDSENMPDDLHLAHERNDEVVERIYIGRRFKNDSERMEKLFELYTQVTSAEHVDREKVI